MPRQDVALILSLVRGRVLAPAARRRQEDELWHGQVFRAYNPSTRRFSPFTFAPRDCIGKNFAQMEVCWCLCWLVGCWLVLFALGIQGDDVSA